MKVFYEIEYKPQFKKYEDGVVTEYGPIVELLKQRYDLIKKYCCNEMKDVLNKIIGYIILFISDQTRELQIESYDFDTVKPIRFCMFCGEKIEVELNK